MSVAAEADSPRGKVFVGLPIENRDEAARLGYNKRNSGIPYFVVKGIEQATETYHSYLNKN